MEDLRFDGRTAIVTGAGGNPSLGRAHALLLAERGANVVVNDIGQLPAGLGYEGEASAEAVAREIREAGGQAVADTNSVATQDGADSIIDTALEAFGSVDILINNAGICPVVSFDDMTPDDFRQTIEINLMGTVQTLADGLCRSERRRLFVYPLAGIRRRRIRDQGEQLGAGRTDADGLRGAGGGNLILHRPCQAEPAT